MQIVRGDVVLARFPFSDMSEIKLRPALVLAPAGSSEAILAFISSNLRPHDPNAEHVLDREDAEFRASGLRVPSIIRLDHIVTLSTELLVRRIGHAGSATQASIDDALRYVFHL